MRQLISGLVVVLSVFLLGLFLVGTSVSAEGRPSAASGNVENGKAIYHRTCVACHGDRAQGDVTFNAPKLAGQEDWYMIRQLENFAKGVRGAEPRDIYGAQMRPMAMTLTGEQDIVDVVAYIMTLSK